jgi:hypothetical protein
MASWDTLASYIKSNYKYTEQSPGLISMVFNLQGGRAQTVLVGREVLMDGGEEWATIASGIGPVQQLRPRFDELLMEAGRMVCGGLAIYGEILFFRHAIPLQTLDINEFEGPLALVTTTADRLEGMFTAGDNF